MTTILHPNYGRDKNGQLIPANRREPISLSDYITVPAISIYGTWQVKELVKPRRLAALARLANELEGR